MNLNIKILLALKINIHVLLSHSKSFKEKRILKEKEQRKWRDTAWRRVEPLRRRVGHHRMVLEHNGSETCSMTNA